MDNRQKILDVLVRNTDDLVKHHIDSQNRFTGQLISNTFASNNPIILPLDFVEGKSVKTITINIGGRDGSKIKFLRPVYVKNNGEATLLQPNTARAKNLTYTSPCIVDIDVEITMIGEDEKEVKRTETIEGVPLFDLPILLRSRLCMLNGLPDDVRVSLGEDADDPGGQFILNGAEKVIVSQERISSNTMQTSGKGEESQIMISSQARGTTLNRITRLKFDKFGGVVAEFSQTRIPVPVAVLFRALGVLNDREIVRQILGKDPDNDTDTRVMEIIRNIIAGGHGIYDSQSAQKLLATFSRGLSISAAKGTMMKDFLPHQGLHPIDKAVFLGEMLMALIRRRIDLEPATDRDSQIQKRVGVTGILLHELFTDCVTKFTKEMLTMMTQEFNQNKSTQSGARFFTIVRNNIDRFFNKGSITGNLEKSLRGRWGVENMRQIDGAVQSLERLSQLSMQSHLRRTTLENTTELKLIPPRRLHTTSQGFICPCETPAGGPRIGIVKALALSSQVSAGVSPESLEEQLLQQYDIRVPSSLKPEKLHTLVSVMVNGRILGQTNNPEKIVEDLRKKKSQGVVHPSVSIAPMQFKRRLLLDTSPARLLRPLLRVDGGRVLLEETLDLIESGLDIQQILVGGGSIDRMEDGFAYTPSHRPRFESPIELVDPTETDTFYIATEPSQVTESHTHCEIHPSLMFGLMGSIIPFAPHNQAPRNQYSTSQSKQATSVYHKQFKNRFDNASQLLATPQRPISNTQMARKLARGKLMQGVNTIVAIASLNGQNQEDGILINKNSIQRGLFHVLYGHEYSALEERDDMRGTMLQIVNPTKVAGVKLRQGADYEKLDEDGLLPIGTEFGPGDVIFGMTTTNRYDGTVIDNSKVAGRFEHGFVENRIIVENSDGTRKVRYRVSQIRTPELGDKFASRSGQKGTVGMIVEEENMPRTRNGIVPDIVVNPHAIPSRMTIGQLQEAVGTKLGSLLGRDIDCTAFSGITPVGSMGMALEQIGQNRQADEVMQSGTTGEQMDVNIFIGPTYQMRLKHMVQDKQNYRGKGPIDQKTRQPVQGRAREGGLRIGEMERDALISWGVSRFLQESGTKRSDEFQVPVCNTTGQVAVVNERLGRYHSLEMDGPLNFEGNQAETLVLREGKQEGESFSQISLPQSMNLAIQEFQAMGVEARIVTEGGMKRLKIPDGVAVPEKLRMLLPEGEKQLSKDEVQQKKERMEDIPEETGEEGGGEDVEEVKLDDEFEDESKVRRMRILSKQRESGKDELDELNDEISKEFDRLLAEQRQDSTMSSTKSESLSEKQKVGESDVERMVRMGELGGDVALLESRRADEKPQFEREEKSGGPTGSGSGGPTGSGSGGPTGSGSGGPTGSGSGEPEQKQVFVVKKEE